VTWAYGYGEPNRLYLVEIPYVSPRLSHKRVATVGGDGVSSPTS